MSNKPPSHIDLSARTLELTAFTRRLRKEYVELIEVSAVLRRDSRELINDSRLLRGMNNKMISAPM
jgi:hypothetical protein